jgi:hypothetical protein
MSMTHYCDIPDDDIIFYALDDLPPGRRQEIKAHLAACSECRHRLAEYRKIARLLRHPALTTDSVAFQTAAHPQAAHGANHPHQGSGRFQRVAQWSSFPRWKPALLVGILLILTVVFLAPEVSRADFPLGRVIGVLTEPARNVPRVISGTQDQPGTLPSAPEPLRYDTADLPFRPVAPSDLPFGLELMDQTWPYPQDVVSRYENAAGLTVELIQTPIAASDLALSPTIETVMVLDTIIMQHTSPEPGAIAALYWVRNGFVFQMSPLRAPYGGLMAEDAYLIVRSLMHAQDAMP